MFIPADLKPGERILHEARRGSSWMYLFAVLVALIPPFVFGIGLFIATYMVDRRSGVLVTDSRLVQHRQWPWPGKFSHAEIGLEHITKVGKSGIGGFDLEQNILNRIFGLGDIEIHHQLGGKPDIIWLHGIKDPKGCIRAIDAARGGLAAAAGAETAQ